MSHRPPGGMPPEDQHDSAQRGGPPASALPSPEPETAFPSANPNPVFRVKPDGTVLYANDACQPLMAAWNVNSARCVPPAWVERFASVLAEGRSEIWDEPCDGRMLQLHCVPIPGEGCVNVYGTDVTLQARLMAELTEERRRMAETVGTSALRVQELEALLELLPIGVAICYDCEGKVIRVNPANADLVGMAPDANVSLASDEARVEPPYRVFEPSGRELEMDELPVQAALRGKEVRGQVVDIERRDGKVVTALTYATPLPDAKGKPRGSVAAFIDISALRAAELEQERLLGELEARNAELQVQAEEIRALNEDLEQRVQVRTAELEAIFAAIPDGLYVASLAGITRCNQAALDAFGGDRLEDLRDGLGTLAERVRPRDPKTGEAIPIEELALARALNGEHPVREVINYHPKTQQDRIMRAAAAPVVVNGQTVAAVALLADITDIKRTEEQLAYQANLLENVNDAIVAFDADMHVTSWNRRAEEMYGWKAAEVLGEFAPAVLGSHLPADTHQAVIAEITSAGRWQGEAQHTHRDGTPIVVETTGMALSDEAGRVTEYVVANRDITARKAAEAENARLMEELRASREQLRGLSQRLVTMQEAERSYVADQLYNRVGQVLAALQYQVARLDKVGDAAGRDSPTIGGTLNQAIAALHDLAAQLRPASLDRAGIARVLGSLVAEFGQRNQVKVSYDPGNTGPLRPPPAVTIAVYRAVQEGLANVSKHSHATEVRLSLGGDNDTLRVTLADNGIGFDLAGGAQAGGLGLASVRELLEAAGGQLVVASAGANGGTVMQICAPLAGA